MRRGRYNVQAHGHCRHRLEDMGEPVDQSLVDFCNTLVEAEAKRHKLDDGLPYIMTPPKRPPHPCWHKQHGTYLDRRNRTLTCRGCGTELDPYDALHELAIEGDWLVRMRDEKSKLRTQLAELRADEKRTKARLRNAKKRLRNLPDGGPHE